jgi:DNA-binding NarL/FixJ family response regulator
LAKHFKDSKEIVSRNSAILSALDDGYTQGEVARYLGLSMVIVSKILEE